MAGKDSVTRTGPAARDWYVGRLPDGSLAAHPPGPAQHVARQGRAPGYPGRAARSAAAKGAVVIIFKSLRPF